MILGIDPGLAGALFFLDPDLPTGGRAVDMPVHHLVRGGRQKREIDIHALADVLLQPVAHAFIEMAGPMPKQGVTSSFSFGLGYGAVLGVLVAHGVPTTRVPAARWKRAMRVSKGKDAARRRASELLPVAADQWRLAGQHGRAEAGLLALYGLRELWSTTGAAMPAQGLLEATGELQL